MSFTNIVTYIYSSKQIIFERARSKFGDVSAEFPSSSSSTWTSTSVAKVWIRIHVKVESKTSEGEGYPHGGVQVKDEMRSKVHSGAVMDGDVEDHRDGTYTITITPQTTDFSS